MENLFNESDFALFAKYQGKTQNEAPEGFEKLRGLYDKLGVVLEELNRIGYHTQINRNPLIQGGPSVMKYSSYHWAKIYPKDNSHYKECDGKVFVVIGTTEDGIDIHLDSNSRKGHNSDKNEITKNLKNDTWCQIEPFEAAKYTTVELAQKVNEFFQDNWVEFNQFAKEFGIQKSIEILKNMDILKITQLLTTNRNLILTGAPGTGKTYLAKQIAQRMIFGEIKDEMNPNEKKQFDEQCDFVQFHPSYDYTDFVEGLRPVKSIKDDIKNIGFERKNGAFKAFCKKALDSTLPVEQNEKNIENYEGLYSRMIASLKPGDTFTERGGKKVTVADVTIDTISLTLENESNESFTKERLIEFVEKYSNGKKLYNEFASEAISGNASAYWAVANYFYEYYYKHIPFVFIIDEINRGEISKIFGELFFSIDPGYRGTDGKVRTQYANMQTTPNDFDQSLGITDSNNYGHFFVPENVYIIGTMNDIDRSVESMDFAFRRRFAFKEITAEDSKQMLDSDDAWGKDKMPKPDFLQKVKDKMDAINKVIFDDDEKIGIEGLSSAYHIGASYFLKLANYRNENGEYDETSFSDLWENHLEGLLLEYMRGMADVQKKIKKLANAYGYSKMNKYE